MCAHVLLYMGAHLLLNLRVGKTAILSLFRNKFIKFNNTGVRVVDSIYHMTLKLKSQFCHENVCT